MRPTRSDLGELVVMAMNNNLPIINAELVTPLDIADAEHLDRRIRLMVQAINDNLTKLYELVEQAKAGEIHKALNYPSWTAYVADVFTVQGRLDRPQRRELVGYLSGEGMSQRAVAAVVGVDQKTVSNDLRAGEEFSSPEPNPAAVDPVAAGYVADDQELADILTMADTPDEQFEEVLVEARNPGDLSRENVVRLCDKRSEKRVTGLDDKQYPAHPQTPAKPRRRPITDAFWRGGYDLGKVVDRLGRLADDDRFDRNRDVIRDMNRGDLVRARDELNRVIDLIGGASDA